MQQIRIKGLGPSYDGLYDFNIKNWKNRELSWIKRFSGYLPLTIQEGYDGGDSELVNCLSLIALYRAGKVEPADVPALWERILDLDFGELGEVVGEPDEQEEMLPPPINSPSKTGSSGDASTTSSESQESPPSPTGIPDSASSQSVREWLAS